MKGALAEQLMIRFQGPGYLGYTEDSPLSQLCFGGVKDWKHGLTWKSTTTKY